MGETAIKQACATQVLVICDQAELLNDLLFGLENIFAVKGVAQVGQAVEALAGEVPIIGVFDMDGLPAGCTLELLDSVHTPVKIFISEDDSLEQRLKAYGLGGDDFVEKPIDKEELCARLSKLLTAYEREQALIKNNEEATKIALNAMTEASMYGDALRFVNDMHQVTDVSGVKNLFFTYMSNLNLTTSIRIRGKTDLNFNSSRSECSPIEMEIFDALGEKDRTISLSNRFIVNGKWVSIIVRDMPVSDELQMGRLRDILATTADGIDAKVLDLQRVDLIKTTTFELSQASMRLSGAVGDHRKYVADAMHNIVADVHSSFHRLDMSEDQEEFFTDLCKNLVKGLAGSIDKIGIEQEVLQCLWISMDNLVKTQIDDQY